MRVFRCYTLAKQHGKRSAAQSGLKANPRSHMHRTIESHRWHTILRLLVSPLVLLLTFLPGSSVSGQQPFYNDDADVTPKRRFHFEVSNELDWLQRESLPSLRQNTLDFELDYGLAERLEIGIEVPV